MIILKRIWLPQRVSIIVSFGSKLNNLLLSNFYPTIPEIAFHFSLFYSTMLRGKGNFICNSCLRPWPRNSCKYWVMCLTSQATIFVTVLDSKPSEECKTTSLSWRLLHFQAQMPLQVSVTADTQATPSKLIFKYMSRCWIPPSEKKDHTVGGPWISSNVCFGLFCPRSFRVGKTKHSIFHSQDPLDISPWCGFKLSPCLSEASRELLTQAAQPCRASCLDGIFRNGLVTQQ